ncbi:MAG TPA: hypothetical protein VJC03_05945, partial [bacterium]|nr:hypothetical protein [bacterium]
MKLALRVLSAFAGVILLFAAAAFILIRLFFPIGKVEAALLKKLEAAALAQVFIRSTDFSLLKGLTLREVSFSPYGRPQKESSFIAERVYMKVSVLPFILNHVLLVQECGIKSPKISLSGRSHMEIPPGLLFFLKSEAPDFSARRL